MRFLFMLSFFALSACSEAKTLSCVSARKELTATFLGIASQGYGKDTLDRLRGHITTTTASCDPKDIETGVALSYGYFALQDTDSALESLQRIEVNNDDEAAQKGYELVHLYTFLRRKEDALREVTTLHTNFGKYESTLLAIVEYTCKLQRCANALDAAIQLEKMKPSDSMMKLWLGYAYADRHEFAKAADVFDSVIANGDIWAFDTTFAVAAIASYSNTKQKEKASALFQRFSALRNPDGTITDPLLDSMQKIVNDKTDRIYLFSRWPEE